MASKQKYDYREDELLYNGIRMALHEYFEEQHGGDYNTPAEGLAENDADINESVVLLKTFVNAYIDELASFYKKTILAAVNAENIADDYAEKELKKLTQLQNGK